MTGRDQEAVQSYLDDLLSEAPSAAPTGKPHSNRVYASAEGESIKAAHSLAATPTALSVTGSTAVALQEQVGSLEVVKRQQLQALLDRPPPAEVSLATTVSPATSVSPAVKPEFLPEINPVVEPELDPTEPDALGQKPLEQSSPLLRWCENGRPVWAQQAFDVLLFRVSGLTLAVPLIALGHIHPLTDGLTPIFGQAEWFMGLQPTPAGRIRTVNTALFVMPERYNPAFLQSARFVVSIDGLDWGLAVDDVQQPTRLAPEDVTWRSERSKRPWLAGTVRTAMCVLLDVPQMGRILQSQDRKRARTSG